MQLSHYCLIYLQEPRAWTSSKHTSDDDRKLIESVGFSHAGQQCYAYVLAKAGIDIFDWKSIQLYEAYSPFAHDLSRNVNPVRALQVRIDWLTREFTVTEFDESPASEYKVKIPLNKLVIGVANKWADGLKFCKVSIESVADSYWKTITKYCSEGFLGVMFWVSYCYVCNQLCFGSVLISFTFRHLRKKVMKKNLDTPLICRRHLVQKNAATRKHRTCSRSTLQFNLMLWFRAYDNVHWQLVILKFQFQLT